MKYILINIIICINFYIIYCKNILIHNMFSSKSHSASIHPLAKELTLLGNNVTLFNYGVKSIGKYSGIITKEILFNDTEMYESQIELFGKLTWRKPDPAVVQILPKLMLKYGMYLAENNDYMDILNTKWDAIIVNEALIGQAAVSAIYMKEKHNTPIISLSTTGIISFQLTIYFQIILFIKLYFEV